MCITEPTIKGRVGIFVEIQIASARPMQGIASSAPFFPAAFQSYITQDTVQDPRPHPNREHIELSSLGLQRMTSIVSF